MSVVKKILIPALLILTISACNKNTYTPKPHGYFRIDFPEKDYQEFQIEAPFTFEQAVYTKAVPDQSARAEPYWYNIQIPANNATIHLSYKKVNNNLHLLTEDSRELAYKHSIKASSIAERVYTNESKNVYGTTYNIKGNTASPFQFHLTDSTNHFIKGSFYINEHPNYDSLQPVIEFIEEDILHLIETFSWK